MNRHEMIRILYGLCGAVAFIGFMVVFAMLE